MTKAMMIRRKKAYMKKKKAQRRCRILLLTFFTVCMLFTAFAVHTVGAAQTKEDSGRYKYYTSITIQYGDTLWSIAEKYYTDDYSSLAEYINEIKELNGLTGDTIRRGFDLCIPYYSDQLK